MAEVWRVAGEGCVIRPLTEKTFWLPLGYLGLPLALWDGLGLPLAPFGVPLGSLWGALGPPLAPFGVPWTPFGSLSGALGLPLAPLGWLWAPFGRPWGPLETPWVALWRLLDFVENWTSLSEEMCQIHCK